MDVPSNMKAWRTAAYAESGNPQRGIDALTLEDVPVPQPTSGQVLIKVAYASVNPIDWLLMTGAMDGQFPMRFPYVPGFDVSGVVAAVNGAERLKVGDRVCCDFGVTESCVPNATFGPCGGFAEYCVAPESLVAKCDGVHLKTASALPLVAVTAQQALFTG